MPDSVPQNTAAELLPTDCTITLAPEVGRPVLASDQLTPSFVLFRTPAGGAATKIALPFVVMLLFPVPMFKGAHWPMAE